MNLTPAVGIVGDSRTVSGPLHALTAPIASNVSVSWRLRCMYRDSMGVFSADRRSRPAKGRKCIRWGSGSFGSGSNERTTHYDGGDAAEDTRAKRQRSARRETTFVRRLHVLSFDADRLAAPHLLGAIQESHAVHGHVELRAVDTDEATFDLRDLRSHRSAKGDASDVIDVERKTTYRRRARLRCGLQRIAAHERHAKCNQSPVSRDRHDLFYQP